MSVKMLGRESFRTCPSLTSAFIKLGAVPSCQSTLPYYVP